MGDAAEGDEMVRAHGMEAQPGHHHHVGIGLTHHGLTQDTPSVHVVSGQELLGPQLRHALGRLLQVGLLRRIVARSPQQSRDGRGHGVAITSHARSIQHDQAPGVRQSHPVMQTAKADRKLRWGILGVAKIACEKIIPAIARGETGTVVAIASRTLDKARAAAARFGIARAYGSYEELLADPEVDAVYNPLPNHLHVPWSIKAAEAGKHVLCEKPIALSAEEARTLVAARDRTRVVIQEAVM